LDVRFRITRHSTGSPPEEALELLAERIGPRRSGVSFARVGREIRANIKRDDPVSMTSDERVDIARREVLDIVAEVCTPDSGLKLDWYAVSPAR